MSTNNGQIPKETPAVIEYLQPGETLTNSIIERMSEMVSNRELVLPKTYIAENAIRSAWLHLQDVEDRDGNPALRVCTKHSIANAIMRMVRKGLNVDKDQGYFIVYGKSLEWQDSYLGTMAIAKREGVVHDIQAMCIYKKDDYATEVRNGHKYVIRHDQPFANIVAEELIGAYCVIWETENSEPYVIEMTMPQIRLAWMHGTMKGNSKAHNNFPDQMAMKTVIQRALKPLVKTTDDSALLDDQVVDVAYNEVKTKIENESNRELLTIPGTSNYSSIPLAEAAAPVVNVPVAEQIPNDAQAQPNSANLPAFMQ